MINDTFLTQSSKADIEKLFNTMTIYSPQFHPTRLEQLHPSVSKIVVPISFCILSISHPYIQDQNFLHANATPGIRHLSQLDTTHHAPTLEIFITVCHEKGGHPCTLQPLRTY